MGIVEGWLITCVLVGSVFCCGGRFISIWSLLQLLTRGGRAFGPSDHAHCRLLCVSGAVHRRRYIAPSSSSAPKLVSLCDPLTLRCCAVYAGLASPIAISLGTPLTGLMNATAGNFYTYAGTLAPFSLLPVVHNSSLSLSVVTQCRRLASPISGTTA